jgi:hypothetical protein
MIKTPAKDFYNLLVPGELNLISNEASAVLSYYKQLYAKKNARKFMLNTRHRRFGHFDNTIIRHKFLLYPKDWK